MNDPLPDTSQPPSGAPADARIVRDDIDVRVRTLVTELTISGAAS